MQTINHTHVIASHRPAPRSDGITMAGKSVDIPTRLGHDMPASLRVFNTSYRCDPCLVASGYNQLSVAAEDQYYYNINDQSKDIRFYVDCKIDDASHDFQYVLSMSNTQTGANRSWTYASKDYWTYLFKKDTRFGWWLATLTFKKILRRKIGKKFTKSNRDAHMIEYLQTCKSPFKLESTKHWSKIEDALGSCYILPRRGLHHGSNVSFRYCTDLKDKFMLDICACLLTMRNGKFEVMPDKYVRKNLKEWLENWKKLFIGRSETYIKSGQQGGRLHDLLISSLHEMSDYYRLAVVKHTGIVADDVKHIAAMMTDRRYDDMIRELGVHVANDGGLYLFVSMCDSVVDRIDRPSFATVSQDALDIGIMDIAINSYRLNDRHTIIEHNLYARVMTHDLHYECFRLFRDLIGKIYRANACVDDKKIRLMNSPFTKSLIAQILTCNVIADMSKGIWFYDQAYKAELNNQESIKTYQKADPFTKYLILASEKNMKIALPYKGVIDQSFMVAYEDENIYSKLMNCEQLPTVSFQIEFNKREMLSYCIRGHQLFMVHGKRYDHPNDELLVAYQLRDASSKSPQMEKILHHKISPDLEMYNKAIAIEGISPGKMLNLLILKDTLFLVQATVNSAEGNYESSQFCIKMETRFYALIGNTSSTETGIQGLELGTSNSLLQEMTVCGLEGLKQGMNKVAGGNSVLVAKKFAAVLNIWPTKDLRIDLIARINSKLVMLTSLTNGHRLLKPLSSKWQTGAMWASPVSKHLTRLRSA